VVAAAVGALVLAVGCATETGADSAPTADGALSQTAQITSADGLWTLDAQKPFGLNSRIRGSAALNGPSGQTTKAGVCLLKMTTVQCTGFDSVDPVTGYQGPCSTAIPSLPAGGYRYCTQIDGAGPKYCAYRPGDQTGWCAGSPALGGTPVGPGTYTTPLQTVSSYDNYVSDACFMGCFASDPSVSSVGTAPQNMCKVYPGTYCGRQVQYCQDNNCDGVSDGVCLDTRGVLFTCAM
jgi:hypothetical protein